MKYYLIQKDDVKSRNWAERFPKECQLVVQSGSPIRAPIFLIRCMLTKGRPAGYIVRYLNDYRSLPKTILRIASEVVLVVLCTFLRIELYWISHNVDKETIRNYPRISRARRWLFATVSNKILVTDSLLIACAHKVFPKQINKLQAVSFGPVDIGTEMNPKIASIVREHIAAHKSIATVVGLKPLVLFCAGSPGHPKYLHFELVPELVEKAKTLGFYIIPIMAGDFNAKKAGRALLSKYDGIQSVLAFDRYTKFSEDFIVNDMDFYWRVYDDWSVPFTVYEAALVRKPILTMDIGFLPALVENEKLGFVLDQDWRNLEVGLNAIHNESIKVDPVRFFRSRGWSSLSKIVNPHCRVAT